MGHRLQIGVRLEIQATSPQSISNERGLALVLNMQHLTSPVATELSLEALGVPPDQIRGVVLQLR